MNRNVVILVILLYVVIFFVYAATSPDPTSWVKNYRTAGQQPFDLRVLYERLDDVLEPSEKEVTQLPIYNTLRDESITETVFIDIGREFGVAALDMNVLLDYTSRGNDVFISASAISEPFLDTLGLKATQDFMPPVEWTPNGPIAATQVTVNSIPDSSYMALTELGFNYFTEWEENGYEPLGYAGDSSVIFLRVPMGDGNMYLHFIPSVFSNYYMLYSDMPEYVAGSLSYLPEGRKIYWSDYRQGDSSRGGVLGVLGRSRGFNIAYWMSIVGVLLFILFTAKRRQRMVPVVTPPRNTGLDFVNTMGDLYFNTKHHRDLVDKKFTYFQDYVRNRYRVSGASLDQSFATRLAAKSNKSLDQIIQLLTTFKTLKEKQKVQPSELLDLQEKLDVFYERN